MILEKIRTRQDLLALTPQEDAQLCSEIRSFLVEHVSRTGGHLASNLGIVEATLAIHKVFDTSRDRLVFDVGHQCYVHKILTGRMDAFDTLRQYDGLSGFPKPTESIHDAFIAGHASNSVSVALGMARARTLQQEQYSVVALMGDGALTGGLAYEGLDNAGESREPMIVILNDNGMSITPNVGAIARYLAQVRLRPGYIGLKLWYRQTTGKTKAGQRLYQWTHRVKDRLRRFFLGTTLFENLGFTYLGPVDGHDIPKMVSVLKQARALREPVLVHIITQKGRGYEPAAQTPETFHGIGPFDALTGIPTKTVAASFSGAFSNALCRFAVQDARICAVTAAMLPGTGLEEFSRRFPGRLFDAGIAEEHALCMAAGMAKQGLIPVVAIYSTFLQRAYDMLLHDLALQQLHVVLCVDRAGLVGEDGETHQGIFDVGFLRQIPGMRVYCPASFRELSSMLKTAIFDFTGPVAVRYPRGGEGDYREDAETPLLREGSSCTVVTYGTTVNAVLEAAERLHRTGTELEVLKLPCIAPLDPEAVLASVRKTGKLVVAEEASGALCVADEIFAALEQQGIRAYCQKINLGCGFVPQGSVSRLRKSYGLDADGILAAVQEVLTHET